MLEHPAFRFQIGACVVVCRVQAAVPEPVSDDGHIDTRGYHLDADAVPEGMGSHAFLRQGIDSLRCRTHVLAELKSDTRCSQRLAVSIDREWFVISTWLSLQ